MRRSEFYTGIKCGKRRNEWIISINGKEHSVYFEANKKVRKYRLWVDNEEVEIPATFITKYLWIEQIICIEGKKVRCVYDGERFDLVIQGRYYSTQKKYYPLNKLLFEIPLVFVMIIVEFILIAFEAPAIPTFICIVVILMVNAMHTDYLIKKIKEE